MPDRHDHADDDELSFDDAQDATSDEMHDDETPFDDLPASLPDAGGGTGALERVRQLIAPVVRDLQLDLYDLEFRGGTLRVTIDTPPGSPGGVDLEALTLATRMISRDLDHDDPIAGRYTLEVTSPGLERTLRTPAHFQREIGKTVALRLRDVTAGERRLSGVLIAADAEAATIRLDEPVSELGTERRVAYDQIDRARTVFVWGPAPKPGKGPKPGAKRARPATSTSPTSSPTTSSQEAT